MSQFRLIVCSLVLILFCLISRFCPANAENTHENITIQESIAPRKEAKIEVEPNAMDDIVIEKFNVLASQLMRDFNKRLAEQRDRIDEIETSSKANEKSISNHFTIVSLFAGAVIGLVALVLGLGAYRFYMDNRRIRERMDRLLERQFSIWLRQKEAEYEKILQKLLRRCESDMQNFSYFVRLRFIIEQPHPSAEEIYPLLTPLSSNPKWEYKPVFNKIVGLNIHPEITAKARAGLKKLTEI